MPPGLLQANLNHARRAQDLFVHSLAERGLGIGVAAEPYRVPEDHPSWFGSPDGSVAIYSRPGDDSPACVKIGAGEGFVAVKWGPISVIGVYIPPRHGLAHFQTILDGLGQFVGGVTGPLLVAGDFNAKSPEWGSRRPDRRGTVLGDWAAELDLRILNRGSSSTCVRPQGESIVDLTWANPSAVRLVREWRVLAEETLSDHMYIEILLRQPRQQVHRRRGDAPRRWAIRKMDADRFEAALLAASWPGTSSHDVEEEAEGLRGLMTQVCDVAMPRARPLRTRAAYWWSAEIAELRSSAKAARRRLFRARQGGSSQEVFMAALGDLRAKRNALSAAIRMAKARAWDDLVSSLDMDPWGRPYKLVLNKLRPWAPPVTESMDSRSLERVLATLFPPPRPVAGAEDNWGEEDASPWDEALGVTEDELARVVKRVGSMKAPGPDGIPGRSWVRAASVLGPRLRRLFTGCLREGVFPGNWRRANLVLLPKPGKPAGSPSAYRPICLLDELGKLFERILADRLVQHLSTVGPDLHHCQFGFRRGLSTLDAIKHVETLSDAMVEEGGVALGVSLDISNAFNTLPWAAIGRALKRHRVPAYLVRALRAYLKDRLLLYSKGAGQIGTWPVTCGVPQGSILGPLLWDLAFDDPLAAPLPPGSHCVAYADDTFVVAPGEDWDEAVATANVAVAAVVGRIRALGLEVAPQKSEAIFFHRRRGEPPPARVLVGGTPIPVGVRLKYLGLTLDGKWTFHDHFDGLAPRLERVAGALGRLLPNLGGPDGRVRRLYSNVVSAVALYGSPIWASRAAESKYIQARLRRAQRRIAARVARCYRTVSHEAATLLAGLPPLDLVACMNAEVWGQLRELRAQTNGPIPAGTSKTVRVHARRRLLERWKLRVVGPPASGGRVAGAIGPRLQEWLERGWGGVSYRMAQVFSGHGSFGEFLCHIGKVPTTACNYCDGDRDSAQHTLEFCPAWAEQRRVLVEVIGEDLTLPALVVQMTSRREAWDAVASFCGSVMARKEADGRRRGRTAALPAAAGPSAAPQP